MLQWSAPKCNIHSFIRKMNRCEKNQINLVSISLIVAAKVIFLCNWSIQYKAYFVDLSCKRPVCRVPRVVTYEGVDCIQMKNAKFSVTVSPIDLSQFFELMQGFMHQVHEISTGFLICFICLVISLLSAFFNHIVRKYILKHKARIFRIFIGKVKKAGWTEEKKKIILSFVYGSYII